MSYVVIMLKELNPMGSEHKWTCPMLTKIWHITCSGQCHCSAYLLLEKGALWDSRWDAPICPGSQQGRPSSLKHFQWLVRSRDLIEDNELDFSFDSGVPPDRPAFNLSRMNAHFSDVIFVIGFGAPLFYTIRLHWEIIAFTAFPTDTHHCEISGEFTGLSDPSHVFLIRKRFRNTTNTTKSMTQRVPTSVVWVSINRPGVDRVFGNGIGYWRWVLV